MEILIYKNDEQHGPMDEVAVRQAVARGEFTGDDMGWREGCEDWVPLKTIVALPAVMPASVRVPVDQEWQPKARSQVVAGKEMAAVAGGVERNGTRGALLAVLAGLRSRTAYRGARTMVTLPFNIIGGVLVVLGLAMVIIVVVNLGGRMELASSLVLASGMIIGGMFYLGLAALASAVFDIADAALARHADGEVDGGGRR